MYTYIYMYTFVIQFCPVAMGFALESQVQRCMVLLPGAPNNKAKVEGWEKIPRHQWGSHRAEKSGHKSAQNSRSHYFYVHLF